MRELKIGDRVVDWKDRAGVVIVRQGGEFISRYDDGSERQWDWYEYDNTEEWVGTFRFEDTEYPEWPR